MSIPWHRHEKVSGNVARPGSFPCAGSLELACHVIFGDEELSRGGGGGGDGCQKLWALGCKVLAVKVSVLFVLICCIRQCVRSSTLAGTDITDHHIEISECSLSDIVFLLCPEKLTWQGQFLPFVLY